MTTDFDNLLLNETPDAIVISTPAGKVVYWNKGAESVFGYTSAEAVGCLLSELVVPAGRIEEERKILQETIEIGSATCESMRRNKDGSLIHVDISRKAIEEVCSVILGFASQLVRDSCSRCPEIPSHQTP